MCVLLPMQIPAYESFILFLYNIQISCGFYRCRNKFTVNVSVISKIPFLKSNDVLSCFFSWFHNISEAQPKLLENKKIRLWKTNFSDTLRNIVFVIAMALVHCSYSLYSIVDTFLGVYLGSYETLSTETKKQNIFRKIGYKTIYQQNFAQNVMIQQCLHTTFASK